MAQTAAGVARERCLLPGTVMDHQKHEGKGRYSASGCLPLEAPALRSVFIVLHREARHVLHHRRLAQRRAPCPIPNHRGAWGWAGVDQGLPWRLGALRQLDINTIL